jgi:hypothetical protein
LLFFFMQAIALRLVCDGTSRQSWGLTETATLQTTGLTCIADGPHHAVHIASGSSRDVYLVENSFVLKLCRPANDRRSESNRLEAEALQATRNLRQTPSLLFTGECVVEVFPAMYGGTHSITLAVSALLASYEGPSLDHLMRAHFALPYNQTTALFCLVAYQELAMMVFEGVAQQISYTDVFTNNVGTLVNPTQFVFGDHVPVVILDAATVWQGKLRRSDFNSRLEEMFNHIVQECAFAQDQSWHFFGELISQHFTGFFRYHGNIDLCEVKQMCLVGFQRLIIDVLNHR